MKWSSLIDEKTGIFSKDFCKVFFLELTGEVNTYRALLDNVYSDCSAFVHGEKETHIGQDSTRGFNRELAGKCVSLRENAHDGLLFGFLMRFLKELNDDEKRTIESSARAKFSQFAQVRDLLPRGANG